MSGEQAMNKEEINCQHLNFFLALYCLPQWFSCEKDPSFHGENSFPDGSVVKNLPAVQEMWVWSLGGEDLREGSGNPLQYLFLGNPMDRGAWKAPVHGGHKRDRHWTTIKWERNVLSGLHYVVKREKVAIIGELTGHLQTSSTSHLSGSLSSDLPCFSPLFLTPSVITQLLPESRSHAAAYNLESALRSHISVLSHSANSYSSFKSQLKTLLMLCFTP